MGSHLVDSLMTMGHDVIVLDNFFTGRYVTATKPQRWAPPLPYPGTGSVIPGSRACLSLPQKSYRRIRRETPLSNSIVRKKRMSRAKSGGCLQLLPPVSGHTLLPLCCLM